jgi:hypothetical protein
MAVAAIIGEDGERSCASRAGRRLSEVRRVE